VGGVHTLRHTCASRLFAAGRNAVQVQRWRGHHSPASRSRSTSTCLTATLAGQPFRQFRDQRFQTRAIRTDPHVHASGSVRS
jgi:integrase